MKFQEFDTRGYLSGLDNELRPLGEAERAAALRSRISQWQTKEWSMLSGKDRTPGLTAFHTSAIILALHARMPRNAGARA